MPESSGEPSSRYVVQRYRTRFFIPAGARRTGAPRPAGAIAFGSTVRYPTDLWSNLDLIERVILQSALGPVPWPDRRTRVGARHAFAAATEGITGSVVRAIMRTAPDLGLRMLLGALSALPARQVVTALSAEGRTTLINLFSRMRSGRGFLNDLAARPNSAGRVTQPTLAIASRNDGAVPFAHAEALASTIQHSRLVESDADSHLIWFSPDWPVISRKVRDFLTTTSRLLASNGSFPRSGLDTSKD